MKDRVRLTRIQAQEEREEQTIVRGMRIKAQYLAQQGFQTTTRSEFNSGSLGVLGD